VSDTITDKEIDQARHGLLGVSNMLSDSNAALLRQAEAMLRYFQLTRKRDALLTDAEVNGDDDDPEQQEWVISGAED
jgi:hypothetical protein